MTLRGGTFDTTSRQPYYRPRPPTPPVTPTPPSSLLALTSAATESERERAWSAFLAEYNPLILHVTRSLGGDHDAAMDRYAFVLEALRRDGYRRLKTYVSDGRGSFHTWLAVVTGRICLDEYRHRYGRLQSGGTEASERHARRKTLADLAGSELDLDLLAAPGDDAPDRVVERAERRATVEAALAGLDPADRLILRLRFEEDLSVPEIARFLGEGSPFRLYRRIEKVLTRVRNSLEKGGVRDATT